MKVTLQESSVQVDEVVVTALGIKKEKKALAYSVTEVKSEELNRVKVSNIANSLVGKVAECGSHEELMEQKGKYYELFLVQSKYYGEGGAADVD